MMKTQQRDPVADGLQQAVLQAALDGAEDSSRSFQKPAKSPAEKRNGAFVKGGKPGPGRPKGSVPKVTKTIRDAVMEAFDRVGGAEYLVRLAEGTQSDRAAFTGLLNKVLPTQVNANVEGGIKLELSWLAGRSIGTTTAQVEEVQSKVIDLERDAKGKYRIKDPVDVPSSDNQNYRNYESPAGEGVGGTADAGSRPMPPMAQKPAGDAGDA